jgi:hypothetical protein
MCDPLSLGLAAISAVGSIGGALMQASQAQDVANKQNTANEQWVAYQQKIHQEEATAQDQARNAANQAREQTLQKVSPEAQTAEQQAEQARLNTTYQGSSATGPGRAGANPATAAPYALSGETTGVGAVPGQNAATMNSLSSQINAATGQARSRIANLATANSYGGSFGGLGTTVPIAFQRGANQINLQNEIRKGDLQTYGVEQQVQPIRYALGPGYGTAGNIATALAGVAGKAAGAGLAKGFGGFGGGGGGVDMSGGVSDFGDLTAGAPNFGDVTAGMNTMGWGFT